MTILDPFVLPADVVIAPLAQLAPALREQIGQPEGECAVTRPRSRTTSSVVDARTAALLEKFRSPSTIVDAVIAFGADEGSDPRELLDDAFSVLGGFVNEGLLVLADSELAQAITSTFQVGARVGGFQVLEVVHVIVDTEVYLARAGDGSSAALKIARAGAEEELRQRFAHEAAIMASLDGRVNPRLLEQGEYEGRPFLAMSWCAGVDVYEAAADARRLARREGPAVLLELGERLIEAYAHLHAQGVVHGDVHPRNAIVDGGGVVSVVDYGLAGISSGAGVASAAWRGGVDLFMEPELAAARLDGRPDPGLSFRGEQYALGALLYLLLTGAHTHSFALESGEMLRQLLDQEPLPFAAHGALDLPAVERTLARVLAKDPEERYRSTGYLLRAFRAAAARDCERAGRPPGPPIIAGSAAAIATSARGVPGAGERVLEEVLARLSLEGELLAGGLQPPSASAMNGGAGFAYALMRIAALREDAGFLSLADLWATRAAQAVGSHDAFWNEELEIVPETFGESSFYHYAAGVHGVQALLARARCDELSQQLALEKFVLAAREPGAHVDVAFGHAGLLLGCSLLLEAAAPSSEVSALRSCGEELRRKLWGRLQSQPALAQCSELRSLGAAHGWAGYLFALLRWSEAAATPPPEGIEERLEQLAALGRPAGRGMRWPPEVAGAVLDSPLAASWCNGAAGFVQLWSLAHRLLGEERFAALARQAGWSTYEGVAAGGDLCCGYAGRAHALLCLYRHGGEAHWLLRARELTGRAAESIQVASLRRDSLYKGDVGVALLVAELSTPELACMPLFEGERWPVHTA